MQKAETMMDDGSYVCDSCGEEIIIPIDGTGGASQEYVEDCPVCCRPHLIRVTFDSDGEAIVHAEPELQ
jgi:hypothetical protein